MVGEFAPNRLPDIMVRCKGLFEHFVHQRSYVRHVDHAIFGEVAFQWCGRVAHKAHFNDLLKEREVDVDVHAQHLVVEFGGHFDGHFFKHRSHPIFSSHIGVVAGGDSHTVVEFDGGNAVGVGALASFEFDITHRENEFARHEF